MSSPKLEREIRVKASSYAQRLIDFTKRLIAAPSENPPGDEREVAALIVSELHELGVTDCDVVCKEEKRPNIVCRVQGCGGGPTLLYNGHMDTKPAGDKALWRNDPFTPTVLGETLWGLGSVDMKSGVAALVYAAGILQLFAGDLRGSLVLVLNADEEAGGKLGAKFIAEERGLHADFALVAEPSGISRDWQYLYLGSRGESCFRVRVFGTRMHSCLADRMAARNANLDMADILMNLGDDLVINYVPHSLYPTGITVTPAVTMRGGEFYGIVPAEAQFITEIRVLPGMTREGVKRDLGEYMSRLRRRLPSADFAVEFVEPPMDWIAPTEVPHDHAFIRILRQTAKEVLPESPEPSLFPAWTDARYYQLNAGIPTVPAFGPGLLPLAHSPNEHVTLGSIAMACEVYALSAYRYLQ